MLLQDKVVVVSGIGPGLGTKLALAAAREGGKLVLAARTLSKLDEAERAIRDAGYKNEVLKQPTDITDVAHCRALVAATVQRFGHIDVLLNSAYTGGRLQQMVEVSDLSDWRFCMDTNLFGTMQLTLAAIPHMKHRRAAIVMVNSMVMRLPMPTQAAYAVSKGALKTAVSYLAKELGQYGIRVNSTFMGWMWGTPVAIALPDMAKASGKTPEEFKKDIEKDIPLGYMPTDTECANAVIMLASDMASVITGACLDVNGGQYLP